MGNHSHYHARMSLLTEAGLADDLARSEAAIGEVLGLDPKPWFRLPFGDGFDDPVLLGRLAGHGYRHVHWDIDGLDWRPEATAAEVAAAIDGALRTGDATDPVVLLHAWPRITPGVVAEVVGRAADLGVRFVRLDELAG